MLQKRLLAIAFIIVIVELLLVIFIIDATRNKISQSLILTAYEKEKLVASQISHSLEQDFIAVQDMLNLVALSPEIQTGTDSACQAKLTQVFPIIEKKIANIVRINEKGIVYCAVNRDSIGINVLTNKELKDFFDVPDHKPTLHRIVLSPVSKKYVAGIHVPVVTPKGEFKGSIGGVVYFDELEKKYFKDFKLLERGRLTLIDDNGDILYNPVFPEIVGKNLLSDEILNQISELDREDYKSQIAMVLSGIRENVVGTARYHYYPNPEMIAVYHPVEILENRHWAVLVSVPIEDIINQINKESLIAGFKNFSILGVAMIAIVFITQISLFVYLIRHIVQHLKAQKHDQ